MTEQDAITLQQAIDDLLKADANFITGLRAAAAECRETLDAAEAALKTEGRTNG